MPSIILYNQLDFYNDGTTSTPPSTSGTWSKISAGTPAAPGSYNGSVNVTPTNSPHHFRYTVGSHTADVIINVGTYITRNNEDCSGAEDIYYIGNGVTSGAYNIDVRDKCPGSPEVQKSGEGEPAVWTNAFPSTGGDLWWKFTQTSNTDDFILFEITGQGYGSDGATPLVAIYTTATDCTALVLQTAAIPSSGSKRVFASVTKPGSTSSETYYIRVATPVGKEGKYDVLVTPTVTTID